MGTGGALGSPRNEKPDGEESAGALARAAGSGVTVTRPDGVIGRDGVTAAGAGVGGTTGIAVGAGTDGAAAAGGTEITEPHLRQRIFAPCAGTIASSMV
jgi:hypothetical protein